MTIEVKKTEADFQPIRIPLHVFQPNKARDVSRPMKATTASVPQIYDAQKEPELVVQGGTEATAQVSQPIKQSTNSDILHGIPDPQPLTPPQDATEDEEGETRVEEDWNHGHPDTTKATSQHGIPDPQPLIPPLDVTEDEERKTRAGEMSNEDLIRMKDG